MYMLIPILFLCVQAFINGQSSLGNLSVKLVRSIIEWHSYQQGAFLWELIPGDSGTYLVEQPGTRYVCTAYLRSTY